MDWLWNHREELLALVGTLWALVSGIVALTPTRSDDDALRRLMQRLSFFSPRDVPGIFSLPGKLPRDKSDSVGPMLVVLLCIAPLLGACGGSELRRHVIAAETLDGVLESDAVAMESRIRARTIDRVQAECPTAPDWSECVERVAVEVSAAFARWEASHNTLAAGRDTYVAALRAKASDQSLREMLDEALGFAGSLVEVARSFGAEIDLGKLAEMFQ